MKRRLFFFWFLLGIGFGLLLLQVFNLGVIQFKRHQSLAAGNRIKIQKTTAPRGIIYDRKKRPLVYNVPIDTSDGLARDYLYGPILAHLIGYVDGDYIGRSGLEGEYDQVLAGQAGGVLVEVDNQGKVLRRLSEEKPVPGENLFLTIDLDWQKAAFEALGERRGAVVVSRPESGQILALVSRPSFEPNVFSLREWPEDSPGVDSILADPDQPLFNRAKNGVYPPGSIFKIVTTAAGLEENKIEADTLIEDTGEIRVGAYRYGNWYFDQYGRREGLLDIVRAIKRSNDIFFYRVGERVGAAKLVEWAKKFGLGEGAGFLPEPSEERWFLGNTYHLAIGQGKIGVTPLQVNLMTNVIANGGQLCEPQFLTKSSSGTNLSKECLDVGLEKETIELIKEGMKEACAEGGTAFPFFDFEPLVACKTGTAEFGDPEDRTHAWFTMFVLPDETVSFAEVDSATKAESGESGASPISITVLVEAGGEGSRIAAPIAKKILGKWQEKGRF